MEREAITTQETTDNVEDINTAEANVDYTPADAESSDIGSSEIVLEDENSSTVSGDTVYSQAEIDSVELDNLTAITTDSTSTTTVGDQATMEANKETTYSAAPKETKVASTPDPSTTIDVEVKEEEEAPKPIIDPAEAIVKEVEEEKKAEADVKKKEAVYNPKKVSFKSTNTRNFYVDMADGTYSGNMGDYYIPTWDAVKEEYLRPTQDKYGMSAEEAEDHLRATYNTRLKAFNDKAKEYKTHGRVVEIDAVSTTASHMLKTDGRFVVNESSINWNEIEQYDDKADLTIFGKSAERVDTRTTAQQTGGYWSDGEFISYTGSFSDLKGNAAYADEDGNEIIALVYKGGDNLSRGQAGYEAIRYGELDKVHGRAVVSAWDFNRSGPKDLESHWYDAGAKFLGNTLTTGVAKTVISPFQAFAGLFGGSDMLDAISLSLKSYEVSSSRESERNIFTADNMLFMAADILFQIGSGKVVAGTVMKIGKAYESAKALKALAAAGDAYASSAGWQKGAGISSRVYQSLSATRDAYEDAIGNGYSTQAAAGYWAGISVVNAMVQKVGSYTDDYVEGIRKGKELSGSITNVIGTIRPHQEIVKEVAEQAVKAGASKEAIKYGINKATVKALANHVGSSLGKLRKSGLGYLEAGSKEGLEEVLESAGELMTKSAFNLGVSDKEIGNGRFEAAWDVGAIEKWMADQPMNIMGGMLGGMAGKRIFQAGEKGKYGFTSMLSATLDGLIPDAVDQARDMHSRGLMGSDKLTYVIDESSAHTTGGDVVYKAVDVSDPKSVSQADANLSAFISAANYSVAMVKEAGGSEAVRRVEGREEELGIRYMEGDLLKDLRETTRESVDLVVNNNLSGITGGDKFKGTMSEKERDAHVTDVTARINEGKVQSEDPDETNDEDKLVPESVVKQYLEAREKLDVLSSEEVALKYYFRTLNGGADAAAKGKGKDYLYNLHYDAIKEQETRLKYIKLTEGELDVVLATVVKMSENEGITPADVDDVIKIISGVDSKHTSEGILATIDEIIKVVGGKDLTKAKELLSKKVSEGTEQLTPKQEGEMAEVLRLVSPGAVATAEAALEAAKRSTGNKGVNKKIIVAREALDKSNAVHQSDVATVTALKDKAKKLKRKGTQKEAKLLIRVAKAEAIADKSLARVKYRERAIIKVQGGTKLGKIRLAEANLSKVTKQYNNDIALTTALFKETAKHITIRSRQRLIDDAMSLSDLLSLNDTPPGLSDVRSSDDSEATPMDTMGNVGRKYRAYVAAARKGGIKPMTPKQFIADRVSKTEERHPQGWDNFLTAQEDSGVGINSITNLKGVEALLKLKDLQAQQQAKIVGAPKKASFEAVTRGIVVEGTEVSSGSKLSTMTDNLEAAVAEKGSEGGINTYDDTDETQSLLDQINGRLAQAMSLAGNGSFHEAPPKVNLLNRKRIFRTKKGREKVRAAEAVENKRRLDAAVTTRVYDDNVMEAAASIEARSALIKTDSKKVDFQLPNGKGGNLKTLGAIFNLDFKELGAEEFKLNLPGTRADKVALDKIQVEAMEGSTREEKDRFTNLWRFYHKPDSPVKFENGKAVVKPGYQLSPEVQDQVDELDTLSQIIADKIANGDVDGIDSKDYTELVENLDMLDTTIEELTELRARVGILHNGAVNASEASKATGDRKKSVKIELGNKINDVKVITDLLGLPADEFKEIEEFNKVVGALGSIENISDADYTELEQRFQALHAFLHGKFKDGSITEEDLVKAISDARSQTNPVAIPNILRGVQAIYVDFSGFFPRYKAAVEQSMGVNQLGTPDQDAVAKTVFSVGTSDVMGLLIEAGIEIANPQSLFVRGRQGTGKTSYVFGVATRILMDYQNSLNPEEGGILLATTAEKQLVKLKASAEENGIGSYVRTVDNTAGVAAGVNPDGTSSVDELLNILQVEADNESAGISGPLKGVTTIVYDEASFVGDETKKDNHGDVQSITSKIQAINKLRVDQGKQEIRIVYLGDDRQGGATDTQGVGRGALNVNTNTNVYTTTLVYNHRSPVKEITGFIATHLVSADAESEFSFGPKGTASKRPIDGITSEYGIITGSNKLGGIRTVSTAQTTSGDPDPYNDEAFIQNIKERIEAGKLLGGKKFELGVINGAGSIPADSKLAKMIADGGYEAHVSEYTHKDYQGSEHDYIIGETTAEFIGSEFDNSTTEAVNANNLATLIGRARSFIYIHNTSPRELHSTEVAGITVTEPKLDQGIIKDVAALKLSGVAGEAIHPLIRRSPIGDSSDTVVSKPSKLDVFKDTWAQAEDIDIIQQLETLPDDGDKDAYEAILEDLLSQRGVARARSVRFVEVDGIIYQVAGANGVDVAGVEPDLFIPDNKFVGGNFRALYNGEADEASKTFKKTFLTPKAQEVAYKDKVSLISAAHIAVADLAAAIASKGNTKEDITDAINDLVSGINLIRNLSTNIEGAIAAGVISTENGAALTTLLNAVKDLGISDYVLSIKMDQIAGGIHNMVAVSSDMVTVAQEEFTNSLVDETSQDGTIEEENKINELFDRQAVALIQESNESVTKKVEQERRDEIESASKSVNTHEENMRAVVDASETSDRTAHAVKNLLPLTRGAEKMLVYADGTIIVDAIHVGFYRGRPMYAYKRKGVEGGHTYTIFDGATGSLMPQTNGVDLKKGDIPAELDLINERLDAIKDKPNGEDTQSQFDGMVYIKDLYKKVSLLNKGTISEDVSEEINTKYETILDERLETEAARVVATNQELRSEALDALDGVTSDAVIDPTGKLEEIREAEAAKVAVVLEALSLLDGVSSVQTILPKIYNDLLSFVADEVAEHGSVDGFAAALDAHKNRGNESFDEQYDLYLHQIAEQEETARALALAGESKHADYVASVDDGKYDVVTKTFEQGHMIMGSGSAADNARKDGYLFNKAQYGAKTQEERSELHEYALGMESSKGSVAPEGIAGYEGLFVMASVKTYANGMTPNYTYGVVARFKRDNGDYVLVTVGSLVDKPANGKDPIIHTPGAVEIKEALQELATKRETVVVGQPGDRKTFGGIKLQPGSYKISPGSTTTKGSISTEAGASNTNERHLLKDIKANLKAQHSKIVFSDVLMTVSVENGGNPYILYNKHGDPIGGEKARSLLFDYLQFIGNPENKGVVYTDGESGVGFIRLNAKPLKGAEIVSYFKNNSEAKEVIGSSTTNSREAYMGDLLVALAEAYNNKHGNKDGLSLLHNEAIKLIKQRSSAEFRTNPPITVPKAILNDPEFDSIVEALIGDGTRLFPAAVSQLGNTMVNSYDFLNNALLGGKNSTVEMFDKITSLHPMLNSGIYFNLRVLKDTDHNGIGVLSGATTNGGHIGDVMFTAKVTELGESAVVINTQTLLDDIIADKKRAVIKNKNQSKKKAPKPPKVKKEPKKNKKKVVVKKPASVDPNSVADKQKEDIITSIVALRNDNIVNAMKPVTAEFTQDTKDLEVSEGITDDRMAVEEMIDKSELDSVEKEAMKNALVTTYNLVSRVTTAVMKGESLHDVLADEGNRGDLSLLSSVLQQPSLSESLSTEAVSVINNLLEDAETIDDVIELQKFYDKTRDLINLLSADNVSEEIDELLAISSEENRARIEGTKNKSSYSYKSSRNSTIFTVLDSDNNPVESDISVLLSTDDADIVIAALEVSANKGEFKKYPGIKRILNGVKVDRSDKIRITHFYPTKNC